MYIYIYILHIFTSEDIANRIWTKHIASLGSCSKASSGSSVCGCNPIDGCNTLMKEARLLDQSMTCILY